MSEEQVSDEQSAPQPASEDVAEQAAAPPQTGGAEEAESQPGQQTASPAPPADGVPAAKGLATFGAGCFWCVEAVFLELDGVKTVESGYMGGSIDNPTYQQVCSGRTGHAEVCHITYDPQRVEFVELLEVFWKTHDPTTLNRQGADFGTQYRSVVFYHNDEQKQLAEKYKTELDASGAWGDPIVTEISPAETFYKAEQYHQNYFALNPTQPYCQAVVRPKLDKFRKVFKDKLKSKAQPAE